MTVQQWEQAIVQRYGRWQNEAVKGDVFRFVSTKHEVYLSVLFKLVIQGHPIKYGPPTLPDLMRFNQRAIDEMELSLAARRRLEELKRAKLPAPGDDGGFLPPQELHREMDAAVAKLRSKARKDRVEQRATKREKPAGGPVTGYESVR